ncbi:enoyl-CoA hydratase [Rhodococcus sp. 05-340-1]|uniref:enoyl-CoA hydratase-related protein n=1 Tax=unclassified Rhodococcus (in: high G+C Gram-positive bacteria) TaxID=192944 RepID=UPI000B9A7EB2|nr:MULTISPECIES: enoyl-CoA hydratase-related protein [unclassified Rhodococcus (in: high G+C Gram-positive bacteria)]OZD71130.1 enoyl-CoA hydratase [Rhodococcus sp. 05-340-2]OZD74063.1 enoyl-CoA hydratase [Rhodococcus sp. 05-340-1]
MAEAGPIETARALYAALASGDREVLKNVLHPSFRGHATEGLPFGLGGDYSDAADMRRNFWGGIAKEYSAAARPEEFVGLEDGRLYVAGRYVGTGRSTGATLDAEFVHVLTFVDGKVSKLVQLTDSQRWHEAVDRTARGERQLTTIRYRVEQGVARITLDRPEQRNAIDLALAEDTLEVARRCAADPTVRAVLIEGSGTNLTVGGDITYFVDGDPEQIGPLLRRMTGPFHEAFRLFSMLDVPIVTAAQGAVAGGGLGFVFAADFVLAAPNAHFSTAFAAIGLSGDGGGSWYLPRLVGPRRAAKMFFQNYRVGAEEAVEWGLVTEVVDADRLADTAFSLAVSLASGPTRAFGKMRRLLRESSTNTLSEHLLDEIDALAITGGTSDARGAIAAFVGKQAPQFEGR